MDTARSVGADPDWTDHNDSDPGITLLQLVAFALVAGGVLAAVRRRRRRRPWPDGTQDPEG